MCSKIFQELFPQITQRASLGGDAVRVRIIHLNSRQGTALQLHLRFHDSNMNTTVENTKIEYNLDLVAIGANRQANSASWGRNGLVAYSASKFVAIYDPIVCLTSCPKRITLYREHLCLKRNTKGWLTS